MSPTRLVYPILILIFLGASSCQRSEFAAASLESKEADWDKSEFSVTDPNLADGETAAVVTIILRNAKGVPLSGEPVELNVTGSEPASMACQMTDSHGRSVCKLKTTIPGRRRFSIKQFRTARSADFIALKVNAVPFGVVSGGDRQVTLNGETFTTAVGVVETDFKRSTLDKTVTLTSSHLSPLVEKEVR